MHKLTVCGMNNNVLDFKIAIYKISVEKLFGKFSYELPMEKNREKACSEVFVLYGDNGSGKTTILQLIYHLLSTSYNRGHKTFVAKIPFQRFEMHLTDGTKIIADRPNGKIIGSFTMSIVKNKSSKALIDFTMVGGDSVKPYHNDKNWTKITNYLSNLGLTIYFLSDDRKFQSDRLRSQINLREFDKHFSFEYPNEEYIGVDFVKRSEIRKREQSQTITDAVERVERWINRKIGAASIRAEDDINTIYADIIKSLSSSSDIQETSVNISNLVNTLTNLAEKSHKYSKFKLMSPLDYDLIEIIKKTPKETQSTILRVMEPYIDGLNAKLLALTNIYEQINTFITSFNQFYTNKKVEFEFYEGIRIISDSKILHPTDLSSGEKQLMLLFCYTLMSRDQPTIFIVDEPEISLNVKWQRKLIKALTGLIESSQVQFIFATHSIELLTQHKEYVVRLVE